MLLMIDNYDSFTYKYFGEMEEEVMVFRNDEITPNKTSQLEPSFIEISPAPCTLRMRSLCCAP